MIGLLKRIYLQDFYFGLANIKQFSKMSRPKKQIKTKEKTSGLSLIDDKTIKLSKQDEENEIKRRKALYDRLKSDREKERVNSNIKEQLKAFEEKLSQTELSEMKFNFQRMINKQRISRKEEIEVIDKKPLYIEKYEENKENPEKALRTPNDFIKREENQFRNKIIKDYIFNSELLINSKLKIKKVEVDVGSKRSGILGYKVGMTSQWTKWGVKVPLTIIQVDRCQVIQIKTVENDGYCAMQLGCGDKNLKKLKKPEIGHLLKNDIPPKKDYKEFKVDPVNLLPIGYQLSVRHYTPGQLVDVQGISIDKNFQGAVKRWNFKMQPQTHGNSLCHRAIGSTGQRTDAGKVFKNKKMAGHMGNSNVTMRNLKIYKIDAERSLIYVIGSIPGRNGNLICIRDAYQKYWQNHKYLNYPTFIMDKDPDSYAQEILMEFEEEDPNEVYIHDNSVID